MASNIRRGTVYLSQINGSARSQKVRVDLGEESSFTTLPAPVKVGDASYVLGHGQDGYRLLSAWCPQPGGGGGYKTGGGRKGDRYGSGLPVVG